MAKAPYGMNKADDESESEKRLMELHRQSQEKANERARVGGRTESSLPVIVKKNGKYDMEATADLDARNYKDALDEKYNPSESARGKAKKGYNVPAQITDEDRQKAAAEVARSKREMKSESNIPASDKAGMEKMLEGEEGFKRGGSVRKYAMGGLVRGSTRGCGVALRGLGKGKVY